MPRTAIDVDNVLCDTFIGARMAKMIATGLASHQIIDTYDYGSPFTHADPEMAKLLLTPHAFWTDARMIAACPPMPGAALAVNRAAYGGHVAAYVTRRSDTLSDVTEAWLRLNGFPDLPLHFVGSDDEHLNHEMTKSAACRAVGATHLIDDSQQEAADAIANGIHPILVDHPLGRKARNVWLAKHPGIVLAADIAAAVDLLELAA